MPKKKRKSKKRSSKKGKKRTKKKSLKKRKVLKRKVIKKLKEAENSSQSELIFKTKPDWIKGGLANKAQYQKNDYLLFGPETRGLPDSILSQTDNKKKIAIPMQDCSRSLNLSNSVAIILFEAWRQLDFA